MSKLFSTPGFKIPKQRNGFDMSQRKLFTCPTGMLLPIYTDLVQAGDKYKLNTDAFIRTEAVETAAFQQFRMHFDWFFVPFRQLYMFWNEFYNGVFDANTNIVHHNYQFALPTVNFTLSGSELKNNTSYFTKNGTDFIPVADSFGSAKVNNLQRLYDLLGFGTSSDFIDGSSEPRVPNDYKFFPYKHLAYHKIFFSHYFRGDWTTRDTELFNCDAYYGREIPSAVGDQILSTIHYRPYVRDYFTNIFPSPIFANNFASITGDSFLRESGPAFVNPEDASASKISNKDLSAPPYPYPVAENLKSPLVTAATIRSLFNFDKLTRITSLAGSHYTDQIRAHFGVDINTDIHNEAYFIGSQSVDINISEVVATASTGSSSVGSNLGDIAGKGFGISRNNGPLNFTAKEQGVLMCIASVEPLQMYASQGISRENRYLGPFDWYRSELDNLGMQPAYTEELSFINSGTTENHSGYQYRFSELKTKSDTVHAGFWAGNKKSWQCNFQQGTDGSFLSSNKRFYVSPSYADNIFLAKFPKAPNVYTDELLFKPGSPFTPAVFYSGDNFLCNVEFNVLKSSCMSVHSLPQLY